MVLEAGYSPCALKEFKKVTKAIDDKKEEGKGSNTEDLVAKVVGAVVAEQTKAMIANGINPTTMQPQKTVTGVAASPAKKKVKRKVVSPVVGGGGGTGNASSS